MKILAEKLKNKYFDRILPLKNVVLMSLLPNNNQVGRAFTLLILLSFSSEKNLLKEAFFITERIGHYCLKQT